MYSLLYDNKNMCFDSFTEKDYSLTTDFDFLR